MERGLYYGDWGWVVQDVVVGKARRALRKPKNVQPWFSNLSAAGLEKSGHTDP